MLKQNLVLFLCILFSLAVNASAFAATYYASPAGSGTSCTLESPCKLNTCLGKLTTGDTLYLRAGTYNQTVSLGRSGTPASRIIVSGYPNEAAIIDGQHSIPGSPGVRSFNPLFSVNADYVTIQDLQIKNSNGTGLELRGNYNYAINLIVEGNNEQGILVFGGYSLVDNCDVFNNAHSNYGGVMSGSWAGGIMMCQGGHHSTVQHSRSWNNWGEGISSWSGDSGISDYNIIQDNISYNNYSNQLYFSNTQYSLAQRNIIYCTLDAPTRAFNRGFEYGDEKSYHLNDSNTIINNLIVGCDYNFSWWGGMTGNGLKNSLIAYNTLVNARSRSNFRIDDGGGTGVHTNARIQNNIFLQEDSIPITDVTYVSAIRWSNNLWSKSPSSAASGSGDIVGDPRLAKTGSTVAGQLTGNYFKLLSTSPAIDKGAVVLGVTDDFFGTKRPVGAYPDMGAHEYERSNPNPLSAPTGLRIVNELVWTNN
jgi:hypothetical protein